MISATRNISRPWLEFLKDIKIEHSLFALPFAASSLLLISFQNLNGLLALKLILCIVFARSFAMGTNRYFDKNIDRQNPRTARRAIPAGRIESQHTLAITLIFGLLFILTSAWINLRCLVCSIPVLLILGNYSLLKRYTFMTHFYLGICLGLSPIAVCVALGEPVQPSILFLATAVALWTAGFDLLYSLQDMQFDQKVKLYSIPARFGPRRAVYLSRACFALMVACLLATGYFAKMGNIYFSGVIFLGLILTAEHILVRDAAKTGASKFLNFSFFNLNAGVSVLFFTICLLDRVL